MRERFSRFMAGRHGSDEFSQFLSYVALACMLLALVVGSSTCIAYAVSEETQNQIDQTKKEKEDAEKAKSDAEKAKNDLNNAKAETQSYLKNL